MEFVSGQFKEYEAVVDFGINFNSKDVKPIHMKIGESILYDGDVADYKKSNGEQVKGPCPSLRSAINKAGWLIIKGSKDIDIELTEVSPTETKADFDPFKGGSFKTYVDQNNGIHESKYPTIKESDLIVKEIPSSLKNNSTSKKEADLSVAGDQIEVKKGFIVNSSTSGNKETKMTMAVERRDAMGSESSSPIKGIKPPVLLGKKRSSFLVDDKTPLNVSEDMTKEEVEGMKTVLSDESQDAKVVKRMNLKNLPVQDVDGVIMRKKTSEGISITTGVNAPKEMSLKTKISSGGEPITSIQEEGTVVGKIQSSEEIDAEEAAKAKAKAEARAQAAIKAQAQAEARKAAATKTQATIEKEKKVASVPANAPATDTDYMAMLPADWGKMHWVKKQEFVKTLTDKAFIEFILSMESIKAVQNACTARLRDIQKG